MLLLRLCQLYQKNTGFCNLELKSRQAWDSRADAYITRGMHGKGQ